jgi:excisionase family DNA binding protein
MSAVPGGRPARPAGRHQGRPPPPATARTRRRSPPGTPRTCPCRPSPPAEPSRPPAAPRNSTAGPFAFPRSPGPAASGGCRPPSAGRGPDLTRRAERSVRRRGPTDGPLPGTPTAPGRPPATPGDPLLTIEEVTAELRVSRAAFYRWRRQQVGPPAVRLPGGGVRVRRSALTAWLRQLEDTQDGQEQGAKWTATTSGSGTSRNSATAPQPATGSAGRWTGASTASRSRPAPSPTGSLTA